MNLSSVLNLLPRGIAQVNVTAPLAEAGILMARKRLTAVAVTDKGRPVGVITEGHWWDVLQQALPLSTPVQAVMSTPVTTVSMDCPLSEAALRLLKDGRVALAVVDQDGMFQGLLTARDILQSLEAWLVTLAPQGTALPPPSTEERWVLALEGAGHGVWDWNAETNRVYFSRQWKAMLGFDEEEVGDGLEEWESRVHPDDLPACKQALEAHLAGATPYYRSQHRVRNKQGEYLWILDQGMVFERDRSGRPLRVVGTHTDITAIKETERALSAASEAGRLGTYALDIRGGVWSGSPGLDAVLGIDEDHPRTVEGWRSLIHPDDADAAVAYLEGEVIGRGQPFDREYRIIRPRDGQVRWVHGLGKLDFAPDGAAMVMHGVIRDITERQELLLKNRLLAEAVGQSPVSIVVTDPEGRLVFVNDFFTRITGYRPEEVLGQNPRLLQSGETPLEIYRDLWNTITAGRTWSGELHNKKKNGELYWEYARISPIRDQGGQITHFVGIKECIDERKSVQDRLKASEQNLRQAQAVSHTGSWHLRMPENRLEWSEETRRIFGVPDNAPVSYALFLAQIHPEDRPAVEEAWEAALQGAPYHIEHRILVHGQVRWVEEQAEMEFDSSGRLYAAVGTVQDITLRKGAEMALAQSHRQLDMLLKLSTSFINLPLERIEPAFQQALQLMGEFAQADRAYVFNYDFEAQTTSNTHEWCAPGITPHIETLQDIPLDGLPDWVRTHRQGRPFLVQDVAALPDGPLRRILEPQAIKSLITLPLMENGRCLGFVGFDSVHAPMDFGQEALRLLGLFAQIVVNLGVRQRVEARLAESEANFRTFFNSINDLLFVLDQEGRIIHTNQQVHDRLGYGREALLGQPVLLVHPEERRNEAAEIVADMLAGQTDHCPVPLLAQDGRLIPVETRVVTGHWNGKPALFGVSRDLSIIAASEEKFSKAFHLSPVAMALTHMESGRFLEVNEAFKQVTGYTAEQVLGKTSVELGLFDDLTQRGMVVDQIRRYGVARHIEVRIRTQDGSLRDGLFSAGTLKLQDQNLLLTQMLDITDRKRAEAALEDERTLLRSLINTLPQLVWLKDADGRYLVCNAQFEQQCGLAQEEILGRSDFDLFPADTAEAFRAADQKAIQERQANLEESWQGAESPEARRLFETTKTPMYGHDGRLIGVLGVARDITEQRASALRIQESELRFKTVVSRMTDTLSLIDRDGNIQMVNERAAQNLGGCPPEQVVGRNIAEFLPPDDAEVFIRRYRQVLDTGQPFIGEIQARMHTGTFWFLNRLTPVQMHEGEAPLILSMSLDITERKQAQDDLRAERDLFTGGPVAVLVWRPEPGWPVAYASPNVAEVFGYESGEMLDPAFRFAQLIHPDDLERIGEEVSRHMSSGERQWEQHYRFVHRDGSTRWLYDYTVAEWSEDGRLKLIRGYVMDDTPRVTADEQLRLSASVFHHAHDGIMICDARERILDVNPTFTEISGYAASDVLGKTPAMLSSGRQTSEFYQAMWREIRSQGYWRGEIWNRRKNGEFYACLMTITAVVSQAGVITHYIGVFSDITLLKSHQEKLELLAHYDALTHLPNRVLLSDRMSQALAQARRSGHLLAIAYLDLDGFKPVNDQYGHDTGDLLLMEVARRLKEATRAGDTVARLGGDEFVLLLPSLTDLEECDRIATRVLSSLSAPARVAGHEVQVSASMGITLFPQDGADADTLLRHADQAMYQAKQDGRNRHHLYDPRQDARIKYRKEALERIAQGLNNNEFVLYYQPKVDMRRGQIVGLEALIRWQHPQHGLLPPGEFLPLLSGHELEIRLDNWVLDRAMAQMEAWAGQGIQIQVSVNITGSTIQAPGFITALSTILSAHPTVDPTQLEFEVLETAALEDMDHIGQVFRQCQSMGFQIALDDFGTGYSSLTYFRRLPANTLKIDQTFIRDMLDDPDDMAIVESVIGLTTAFNRKVIAEGVESTALGAVLLHMGCNLAQGYGIARPMPADAIPAWIGAFKPDPGWMECLSWQWAREDVPLTIVGLEHKRWIDELEAMLETAPGHPDGAGPNPSMDPTHCRFGHWYFGSGMKRYGHMPEFQVMEASHDRVHVLGKRILANWQAGDRKAIEALLAELHQQRDLLLDQIQDLQMAIILDYGS